MSCLRSWSLYGLTVGLLALSTQPFAKLSPEESARLDKDLTPVGAERAGNAAGTIPAWTGGLTKPPAGFDATKGYANPFADEKPLFVIDAKNADQYKANLTDGQMALLKKFPESFQMKVYPSHRTAAFAPSFYEAVKKQATTSELEDGGAGVKDFGHSKVPFPIPKTGIEPIWNQTFVARGLGLVRRSMAGAVYPEGRISVTGIEETEVPGDQVNPPDPTVVYYRVNRFWFPADVAGDFTIVHGTVNNIKDPLRGYQYSAGQRRLRRTPEVGYDGPIQAAEGTRVADDYNGFIGDPYDRFEWKMIGKREVYIPYNNYELSKTSYKVADILKPNHFNPDTLRYELHRVWVVEATLKPGKRHIYAKRVFYLDEDSWLVATKDQYDGRGQLWRIGELYLMQYYDVPFMNWSGGAVYDLTSGRYWFEGLANETVPIKWGIKKDRTEYEPDAARRMGTR